ncbi:alpha/beta-hydrolase [Gloeopeniophorella convolvens]|nr:alpha/beta-hydrolase [Gloeopeniophorella convolvens]
MCRYLFVLASALGVLARPTQDVLSLAAPRPLVIWHGMGDSYASSGMQQVQSRIVDVHPKIFIHNVYIDPDVKEDERAGFYGNINEQIEQVAQQLQNVSELSGGFDAIGFSQGGQFLRAFVERHNVPPVRNLITFGSQHMGVADIAACKPYDLLCQLARIAARVGVYSEWAQRNLVQAQYFRDPSQLPRYLEVNRFLADINNEVPAARNATYAPRLSALEHLVLVGFARDRTVVPKESPWFGSWAPPAEEDGRAPQKTIVLMREQPLYIEDWIGLRALDEAGRVVLAICPGEHMELAFVCWQPLIERYVGGPA